MTTGRGERAIQATVTLISLVVVIGAVPAVLALLVTVPPRHPVVYDLIAVVGWIAWFVEVAKLVGTVRARIHSGDLSVHDGTRLVDRLAIRIAAALMALGVGGSIAVISTAGAATPAAVSTATTMAPTSPSAPATTAPAAATTPTTQTTYTVAPGDTLWSIAVALYGDGSQWSAIAAANYGRTMGGGQAFVDPSLIYPGWMLTLPNLPTQTVSPIPALSPGPSNPAPVSLVQPPDPVAHPSPADREPTVPVDHRPEREVSGRQRSPVPARGGAPVLPELAVLGLGVLAACAIARRVRSARRRSQRTRRPGDGVIELSAEATEMAMAAAPFERLAAMDLLELGLCHLTAAVGDRQDAVPAVRLVRVGPDGLTLFLAEPADWAPGHFELEGDGTTWRLPAAADLSALDGGDGDEETWLPALLPVGADATGTYLLPVEPGAAISITGERSAPVIDATMLVAQSWPWREQVVFVTEPDDAARQAHLLGDPELTASRRRVVYLGDREDLDPKVAARVGVVCANAAGADIVVRADVGVTEVEAEDLAVEGTAVDSGQTAALGALLQTVEAPLPPIRSGPPALPADLQPGSVEVKMLVAVPRVVGWVPPAPNRERQLVRLLAYLAMVGGKPVGVDRLRTRALGTDDDHPVAQKTVQNLATDLRAAVGVDLLPNADAAGRYAVAEGVTTDALRLGAMVGAAKVADDDERAIELLRSALELIEEVPLIDVRAGFDWWESDGFASDVERVVVDAVAQLVPLALAAGNVELAEWAIGRGHLIAPWCELLFELSIDAAAAAGDRARAARIYGACQRMIEELTPGATPSEVTERAYRRAMGRD